MNMRIKFKNNNNTAIQGASAELVKKKNPAPILLNNSVHAGMSEVLCKAN